MDNWPPEDNFDALGDWIDNMGTDSAPPTSSFAASVIEANDPSNVTYTSVLSFQNDNLSNESFNSESGDSLWNKKPLKLEPETQIEGTTKSTVIAIPETIEKPENTEKDPDTNIDEIDMETEDGDNFESLAYPNFDYSSLNSSEYKCDRATSLSNYSTLSNPILQDNLRHFLLPFSYRSASNAQKKYTTDSNTPNIPNSVNNIRPKLQIEGKTRKLDQSISRDNRSDLSQSSKSSFPETLLSGEHTTSSLFASVGM